MLNPVTDTLLAALRAAMPAPVFGADVRSYLDDPRRILEGHAAAVLRPGAVEEVAAIVRFASEHRVGLMPYGGGTGLVGAQIAPDAPAPLIVSLERMNAIRAVYPRENVLIAEAGVTLAGVQAAAEGAGRLFPLSLASEGTARIGGNLSTNAGGVQVLRYGNARDLCLGLEAVLPDGRVWHGLKRLRKDNTGYDLKNLLIGAEGTLGIITAAALRLYPQPGSTATALMAVAGPEAALDLLTLGQDLVGPGLTAFELIHRQGLDFLEEAGLPGYGLLTPRPEWSVLAEVALPQDFDAQGQIEALFARAFERGLVGDGIVAASEAQRRAIWEMREAIPEGNRRIGAVTSQDVSVPLEAIPALISRGVDLLAELGDFRANIFGHVGDGNLHFNVFPAPGRTRGDYPGMRERVSCALHDLVDELGGSFSAEHGIGRTKVGELERLGDPAKLAAMRAIKAALDPAGIMNPGAVLRAPQAPSNSQSQ